MDYNVTFGVPCKAPGAKHIIRSLFLIFFAYKTHKKVFFLPFWQHISWNGMLKNWLFQKEAEYFKGYTVIPWVSLCPGNKFTIKAWFLTIKIIKNNHETWWPINLLKHNYFCWKSLFLKIQIQLVYCRKSHKMTFLVGFIGGKSQKLSVDSMFFTRVS